MVSINLLHLLSQLFSKNVTVCGVLTTVNLYGLQVQISTQTIITTFTNLFESVIFRYSTSIVLLHILMDQLRFIEIMKIAVVRG